ncbi:MAG: membrane integrity-associated transporter subunit PqiC, partial [Nitrospiraceae bacterium]
EFDQWAEPLADNIARVVATNVSNLLSTDHIVVYPWGRVPVKYQVVIGVTRFDAELNGDVSLVVRWGISRLADREVLVARASSFSEPAGGPDYQSQVSAMSRALAKFSREVAAAFKAIAPQKQKRTP